MANKTQAVTNQNDPLKNTETWFRATVKKKKCLSRRELHKVILCFFLPINLMLVIVQHRCLCNNCSLETLIMAVHEHWMMFYHCFWPGLLLSNRSQFNWKVNCTFGNLLIMILAKVDSFKLPPCCMQSYIRCVIVASLIFTYNLRKSEITAL